MITGSYRGDYGFHPFFYVYCQMSSYSKRCLYTIYSMLANEGSRHDKQLLIKFNDSILADCSLLVLGLLNLTIDESMYVNSYKTKHLRSGGSKTQTQASFVFLCFCSFAVNCSGLDKGQAQIYTVVTRRVTVTPLPVSAETEYPFPCPSTSMLLSLGVILQNLRSLHLKEGFIAFGEQDLCFSKNLTLSSIR